MRIAVVIPSKSGGALLVEVVERVLGQDIDGDIDLLLVDSGSPPRELERLRDVGARIESIPSEQFDHGATRDLGASKTEGEVVVFMSQDALPIDRRWLARLTEPFRSEAPPAAVQGGIRELPAELVEGLGRRRFFWDSCGPRFYFTRESEAWIAQHGGLGFSTVNCALARIAWKELPFGRAAILEDKLWQKRATGRGWRIEAVPEAAVWHSHDYGFRSLLLRCVSEGFGWRLVGERYSLSSALTDLGSRATWREWRRGSKAGEMKNAAERLFPLVRPLAVWWGNRWARRIYH
jgi:rhamnosyltransferase